MRILNVDVQGMTIEVLVSSGSQTPIVFCHGNSGSAEMFEPLFQSELGTQHRLVAISFPGHGGSQAADAKSLYSIPRLGELIADVIRALGLQRYVLVGHSLGGHALLEAIECFDHALGLLLISSPPLKLEQLSAAFAPDPTGGALFAGELDEAAAQAMARCFVAAPTSQHVKLLTQSILRTDSHFRPALLTSLARGEMRDEFEALETAPFPIGLVIGGQDLFLNPTYIESLPASKFWKGKIQRLPAYGHALHVEAAPEICRLLADFIRDVEALYRGDVVQHVR